MVSGVRIESFVAVHCTSRPFSRLSAVLELRRAAATTMSGVETESGPSGCDSTMYKCLRNC
jgi:hypothetical protein